MTFQGWPAEAIEFFEGLEADNSKAYWFAHKPVYEQVVRAPMQALIDDLADEFGPGKIFRPHRDVRFSKDKTPYKTTVSAMVGLGYVQLSADGLLVGSGHYEMSKQQLERYRAAVDDERTGTELQRLIARMTKAGVPVVGHRSLKTAPRGWPSDHPRIELLRHKGLTAWREWPVEPWLGTAAAEERIVTVLRTAEPLRQWLSERVGDDAFG